MKGLSRKNKSHCICEIQRLSCHEIAVLYNGYHIIACFCVQEANGGQQNDRTKKS